MYVGETFLLFNLARTVAHQRTRGYLNFSFCDFELCRFKPRVQFFFPPRVSPREQGVRAVELLVLQRSSTGPTGATAELLLKRFLGTMDLGWHASVQPDGETKPCSFFCLAGVWCMYTGCFYSNTYIPVAVNPAV